MLCTELGAGQLENPEVLEEVMTKTSLEGWNNRGGQMREQEGDNIPGRRQNRSKGTEALTALWIHCKCAYDSRQIPSSS